MSQINSSKVNGNGSSASYALDPEVVGRAKRRQFSVSDKLRILREADACDEPGQIGALLRREGIYSSYLTQWRRERENGQLPSVTAHKRGRPRDEEGAALSSLAQENAALKARLVQAELIIAAQKKLAQILEQTLTPPKGPRS